MTNETTDEIDKQKELRESIEKLTRLETEAYNSFMKASRDLLNAQTTKAEKQGHLAQIREELKAQKTALLASASHIPLDVLALIEREQMALWMDLYTDLNQAKNGYWSTGIERRFSRIINIAQMIGITPWEKVPQTIVSSGLYVAVCKKIGAPEPTFLGRVMEIQYPSLWSHTIGRLERFDPGV